MSQNRKEIEKIAAQLSADLADPEQFRTVMELATNR